MGIAERKRTSDEQWFKDTEKKLGLYRTWEKRIEILKLELERLFPSNTPNYSLTGGVSGGTSSDQTGEMATKRAEIEQEMSDLTYKMKQIDLALELLTEEATAIIRLRFIDRLRDWQIYDLSKIPLGKTLYYTTRDEAMKTIARCFGILKC